MKVMRKVAKNYSFGVDAGLLEDIIRASSIEGRGTVGDDKSDDERKQSEAIVQMGEVAKKLKKIIDDQVKDRSADVKSMLIKQACKSNSPPDKCVSSTAESATLEPGFSLDGCPDSVWHCHHARECSAGLRVSVHAGNLVSEDCRPLRERHKGLYKYLLNLEQTAKESPAGFSGRRALGVMLDNFGIEVSMATGDALDHPTRHLSMFFDSYFVASGPGNVIFSAGSGHPGGPIPHHEGAPFVSIAKIRDILSAEHRRDAFTLSFSPSRDQGPRDSDAVLTGHSTVRTIDVNGVALSVFVHPFTVDASDFESEEEEKVERERTWYVVGVVPRKSLTKEAIRIRLGPAADATLAIVLLLAFLPILRFWSASNRSVLSRFGIYGIGASAIGVSALATALGWTTIGKDADGRFLDARLSEAAEDIRASFLREVEEAVVVVEEDIGTLLRCRQPKGVDSLRSLAMSCPEKAKDHLNEELLCESLTDADEETMVQSAFLLDEKGIMEACTQYRRRQSQRLDLGFRRYFEHPHILEPTVAKCEECDWERGPVVFETIDSVVQGKKELVLSFAIAPDGDCERGWPCPVEKRVVGAAVVDLPSSDLVLAPHYYYAIIDEHGETLFHSDDDRERVSNFVEDTGSDIGVRLAIDSGKPHTIDTYYDGRPIRAHFLLLDDEANEFLPLHGKSDGPWILVVYRQHRVTDSLSLLTASLSLLAWSTVTILIFLVIAGLTFLRRGQGNILSAVVAAMTNGSTAAMALVLATVGLVWSYFWVPQAWIIGTLLPVLITGFLCSFAWSDRLRKLTSKYRFQVGVSSAMIVFATVLVCFSVIPMVAWQSYFRGELNAGLAQHLYEDHLARIDLKGAAFREYVELLSKDRVESSLESERPMDRCTFVKKHVLNSADDSRIAAKIDDEYCKQPALPKTEEQRGSNEQDGDEHAASEIDASDAHGFGALGWLEPVLAHSEISKAMMRKGGRTMEREGELEALDADVQMLLAVPVVIVGGILLLFLSYSSVRARLGHAKTIMLLPQQGLRADDLCKGGAAGQVRMLLVIRSEVELREFLDNLMKEYSVCVASRSDDAKAWQWVSWPDSIPCGGEGGKSDRGDAKRGEVLVVRDLRSTVEQEGGKKLVQELATKSCEAVILCTDVVPSYRIGPGTLDDSEEGAVFAAEWRKLTKGYVTRLLYGGAVSGWNPKEWKDDALKTKREHRLWAEAVAAIGEEVRAQRDFQVVGRAVILESKGHVSSELRGMVLRKFRSQVLLRFKDIWSACSNDERLQIIALARGGAPNIRQRAAISSLANRGIITEHDPIGLTSEAFGDFVNYDLAHDSLDTWRRRGHRDWWRVTWLPLVILAGLGLMFFLNSNPEAIGTLGAMFAALIAFVPVVTSLLRIGQTGMPIGGSEVGD